MALMAPCNVRGIIKLSNYSMLNEEEDPNIRSSNWLTVLSIAGRNEHYQVMKLILEEQVYPKV